MIRCWVFGINKCLLNTVEKNIKSQISEKSDAWQKDRWGKKIQMMTRIYFHENEI